MQQLAKQWVTEIIRTCICSRGNAGNQPVEIHCFHVTVIKTFTQVSAQMYLQPNPRALMRVTKSSIRFLEGILHYTRALMCSSVLKVSSSYNGSGWD